MDRPRFVIESAEAELMAKQSGTTVYQLLATLVESAQSVARVPISKYPVGAVGLGSSGRIFLGVNIEFPGLPLHHSIHAEQFLVTNLSLNAEPRLECFAVSDAPCGHCRQFLQELRGASDIRIRITKSESRNPMLENGNTEQLYHSLSHFLPHRFGPDDLLEKDVPLILESQENGLVLSDFCNGGIGGSAELKYAALDAANMSHAPYSRSPSGVALMDAEGRIYKGSYMESAAFNPSLGPLQAALVAYVARGGGGGYERIVGAALVEKAEAEAAVRQEQTARLLLQCIAPKCEVKVFHCASGSKAKNGV